MPEVIVLGDATIDIVAQLESYPLPGGDVQPLETIAKLGGTSLTTAVMLARLGVEAALIARVGPDMFGDYILAQMEREGLSNRWMERDPSVLTGLVYVAVTPGGQRTLFGGAGANRNLAANALATDEITRSHWLHVTSYNVLDEHSLDATMRTMRVAHGAGVPVSLDIGLAPVRLAPEPLARVADGADVLFPSEDSGEVSHHGRTVLRKRGAAGCTILTDHARVSVPAFRVPVVDTTGAGDAFDAGYIAGQVRGLDVRSSTLLANACGAAAVTVLGAGNALPGRDVVLRLLRDAVPDGWHAEARAVLQTFS
jgi:sugar/nucleoside kinase (ribokinase family)